MNTIYGIKRFKKRGGVLAGLSILLVALIGACSVWRSCYGDAGGNGRAHSDAGTDGDAGRTDGDAGHGPETAVRVD